MNSSYSQYFKYCEVKPEFKKEFISLWSGWLGKDNLHKLDEVTEKEWARFNTLIRLIAESYRVELLDCESETISNVTDIESTLSTYEESKEKDSSGFSNYILPELECVLSEDWDFTYILWHKKNGAIKALIPLIEKVGLKHFHD